MEIPEHAVPSWPEGVRVTEGGLEDELREEIFPLNETGRELARRIDGRRSVGDLVLWLQDRYGLESDQARRDVSAFLLSLNQELLLNFDLSLWRLALPALGKALRLAWLLRSLWPLLGVLAPLSLLRWRLDFSWRGVGGGMRSLGRLGVLVLRVWFIPWVLLAFFLGGIVALFRLDPWIGLRVGIVTLLFFPFGVAFHEGGHLFILGGMREGRGMVTFGLKGIHVVLPAALSSRRLAAAAFAGAGMNLLLAFGLGWLGWKVALLRWEAWTAALWNAFIAASAGLNDGARVLGGLWIRRRQAT